MSIETNFYYLFYTQLLNCTGAHERASFKVFQYRLENSEGWDKDKIKSTISSLRSSRPLAYETVEIDLVEKKGISFKILKTMHINRNF
jgi:hypothetical protein